MKYNLSVICSLFDIYGDYITGEPYGSGHINDTFVVKINQSGTIVRYILQRINTNIFKSPERLMENIKRVTQHLENKLGVGSDSSRRYLKLISSNNSNSFLLDNDGNYWRMYTFIEKSKTYDILENKLQAYNAAKAFGEFQNLLVDIPGERLYETIPDFHNTPKRYTDLELAIKNDSFNRLKNVAEEVDFIMKHKPDSEILLKLYAEKEIIERITHNDTKLNNVMIDNDTQEGICVIDLDTVMPGLVHYDFGDLIRTGTSPALEDEQDLSKIEMQIDMFEALLDGYMFHAKGFLNKTEKHYLPFAGKLITLENAVRFLTDHLSGDTYFKIHRDNHNLDRCRTQIKLIQSIERQNDQIMKLLAKY